jgi:acetyltransferase-like isoleucine patch superfamily enzyme
MPNIEIRLQGHENSPVIIEDDVWIAASCVILPGVTIGKGAVIAAGAVVTKSCQAGAVVAGVPGRMIGNRNE